MKPDIELGGVFTVTINHAFDVTADDGGVTVHTPSAAFILAPSVVQEVIAALAERTSSELRMVARA